MKRMETNGMKIRAIVTVTGHEIVKDFASVHLVRPLSPEIGESMDWRLLGV
jgi:hypothetical protein